MKLSLEEALYSRAWLISTLLNTEVTYYVEKEELDRLFMVIEILWLVSNTGVKAYKAVELLEYENIISVEFLDLIDSQFDTIRKWAGKFDPYGNIAYIIVLD